MDFKVPLLIFIVAIFLIPAIGTVPDAIFIAVALIWVYWRRRKSSQKVVLQYG